jgi:hypothetical protein
VRRASLNDKSLKRAKNSLPINQQEERGNSKQMEVVGENLEDYVSRQKFQVFLFLVNFYIYIFISSFVIPFFFFLFSFYPGFPFKKSHVSLLFERCTNAVVFY